MTEPSEFYLIPDLDGVPEDDEAEVEDADVKHLATPEEVEGAS